MPTIAERNKTLRDGGQAALLLDNEVLMDAFDDLVNAATEALYALPTFKEDSVRSLWHHVKAVKQVKERLRHKVHQAEAEKLQMKQELEFRKQLKEDHDAW